MINKYNKLLSLTCCTLCFFVSTASVAQEDPTDEQDIPELHLSSSKKGDGKFRKARVTLSVGGDIGIKYNDNIYRSPSNKESDVIEIFRPTFIIKQDDGTDIVEFTGKLEVGYFNKNDENSYFDSDFALKGSFEVNENNRINASGRFRADHVEIGSFVDSPDRRASEPTNYKYGDIDAEWYSKNDNIINSTGVNFRVYNYDNSNRTDGTRIINDDRDRKEYEITERLGYAIEEQDTIIYTQISGNIIKYDEQVDSTSLISRDSDGFSIVIGSEYGNVKSDLHIDTNIGYMKQSYDSSFLPNVSTLAAYISAQVRASERITIKGRLTRIIKENSINGSSSYIQTRIKTGIKYRYNEDIDLGLKAEFSNNDFQINPASGKNQRTDEILKLSLWGEHDINDDFSVIADYSYANRTSDDSSVEYSSNQIFIRFKMKY